MTEMPHIKLRDSLAHEIEKVELKDNNFIYDNSRPNKNENIIKINLNKVIDDLEQFSQCLEIIWKTLLLDT